MFERFTDRARRVVVLAQEEARWLNHSSIGTEHLLLGLVHEGDGAAARALDLLGVTLTDVRERIEQIVGRGGTAPSGHIPFTPRAKEVLELSLRESLQLGDSHIGTEHVLLALVREGTGVAAQVLVALGADLERVRTVVLGMARGAKAEARPIDESVPFPELAQTAVVRAARGRGPRPAVCSFCGTPSPQAGRLFAGDHGALVCVRCARSIAGQAPGMPPGTSVSFVAARGHGFGWSTPTPSLDELIARVVPSGPPPDDEAAARAETERAFAPPSGTRALEPSFDALVARHVPTGPLPDDVAAAGVAIAVAFEQLNERTQDGRGLVNVEHGEDLASLAAVVESRVHLIAAGSHNVVEHVHFLDASHAVVWLTTVLFDGRPIGPIHRRECRAVLVDGSWKVAYDTVRELWALADVTVPPYEPPVGDPASA